MKKLIITIILLTLCSTFCIAEERPLGDRSNTENSTSEPYSATPFWQWLTDLF